jgi:hypothetical protein
MRTVAFASVAPLLAAAALVAGCRSSDSPPPPEVPSMTAERDINTPPLPRPTYAAAQLPEFSATIVTDVVPVRVFTPTVTSVPASYVTGFRDDVTAAVLLYENGTACADAAFGFNPPTASLRLNEITLQSGGARVAPTSHLDWNGYCAWGADVVPTHHVSGAWSTSIRPLPFAAKEAQLRRQVRWAKAKEHTFLTRSGDFSLAVTYTTGTSVSEATSVSRTVGITGALDFLTLSAELSTTFSRTTTIETSMDETTTISCAPDVSQPGDQFHCSIWQLQEIYDIVDRDASPWSDPFYATAPIPVMVNGTDMTATQVVGF